ncbi:hypothetical protein [Alicyclobacillus dauci]|uniref:Uncharacterized protein n=1 Tax=Alicyclobacillus dauci TaxID=1475485 RepID=A0ABY6Z8Q1_9BACL|nr:hypothetical protein [Alicyclobacillus dauci]WAH38631.1 hypothetical protein NZD86_09175 [Alicyclobacillus dauci]
MSRIVNRPIHVNRIDDEGRPLSYTDAKGIEHRIRDYLDQWREMGDWIRGEGERVMYRVLTADMAMVELEHRWDDAWIVYRVFD